MDPALPHYSSPHRGEHRTGGDLSRSTSTSERPSSGHVYHLSDSKGRPWLTLEVSSSAPTSAYLPAFFEGDAIGGTVSLNREKDDSIKSISVQVIGQMTSSVMEVLNFVQVSEILWTASAPQPSIRGSEMATRLVGQFSWPFSLNLPSHCQIKPPNGETESYPLPGSFSERMARVHIQYQVVATVHRSRFRVNSTIGTVIGYCPIIRPEPPSIARQTAYVHNTPLPGPEGDANGWKCLETLHIRGSVFSTRTVDARCTLSLAKPLCYTRGSVIPCVMTVETTDLQALDLLSAPRSIVVRLLRQVSTGERTLSSISGELPGLEFEQDEQELATAAWRPDGARHPSKRTLHGEIHLSSTLKPTCRLGKFGITYLVAVYPPRAAGFQPGGRGNTVLQQEPVTIATVHAPGPRPRVYSPPSYDDASSMGQSTEFRIFR